MAIPFDNYFDAIGKVAGLTGKQVIDIATSEGNPAIWSILEQAGGPLNKWNVIYDETGNVGSIITGNGQFFNFADDAVGAVTEYVGGNQLITDVAVSGGEMTVFTGDIIDAGTQTVTKKGLLAGASTGANILSGAFAALGGVMTGVRWYQDNPQFWTDLSQKLLPFAYSDPSDKSWGDILYEGLFPTAVDSEGTTYVREDFLSALYSAMAESNIFDKISYSDISNLPTQTIDDLARQNTINPDVLRQNKLYYTKTQSFTVTYKSEMPVGWKTDVQDVYAYSVKLNHNTGSSAIASYGYLGNGVSLNNGTLYNINGDRLYDFNRASAYNNSDVTGIEDFYSFYYYGLSIENEINDCVTFPTIPVIDMTAENAFTQSSPRSNALEFIGLLILAGNHIESGGIDNTSQQTGSIIPQAGKTLAESYPDWYKNAQTSVDPNSTSDNVQYITWLPLTIDNTSNDTQGTTDLTQEQAQQGKPSQNAIESFLEWLQQAYQTQTLPQPETEQAGNSGTETEPPKPEDGGSAGVPVITGAANALWKIYNPSLATLQQFGAWLWSSDPIKMIKEIFSNQPIDGIIGLHAIYVTPQTGGAENIKVGYIDSGVPAPVVTSQYIRFSCGAIAVPLYYQNALDFAYTKVLIYLPFIGIEELDSYDVMGKTLEVVYSVDVLTGIVLAQIIVSAPNYKATLYQFNGSCGVEYPLSSGSRASQMLSLITGAVGGAALGGIGGAVLGGARGAATGANVRMSGNLAGNAGAMGIRKPFIIVKRPIEIAASNYNEIYGYPANITGKLKTFSGFTRIKAAHVDNIPRATAAEKDRILSALQTGVII